MSVKITLTNVGSSISNTLDIYTNQLGPWVFFETVSKNVLISGYTFSPPLGTSGYQIIDNGACGSVLELYCAVESTTTTSTTQDPSITTTTTTTEAIQYWYLLYKCDPNGIDYYAGPYDNNDFSIGMRVEGATEVFYVVTGSFTTEPIGRTLLTGITNTFLMGCP